MHFHITMAISMTNFSLSLAYWFLNNAFLSQKYLVINIHVVFIFLIDIQVIIFSLFLS